MATYGGQQMILSIFATNFYGWTRDFTSVISDGAHSDWRSDLMTSSSGNM